MSTSYTIEVGYNSSYDKAEVGEKLRAVVADIQANPQRITAEVRRVEPRITAEELERFVESYRAPVNDLTCRIVDDDETKLPRVHQCASGGGRSRDLKEICRRAFARLVLEDMHRAHMDVSFTVG
jgi:hypothetical protein